MRLLAGIDGIGHVTFTAADVIRHDRRAHCRGLRKGRRSEARAVVGDSQGSGRATRSTCSSIRDCGRRIPERRRGARWRRPPLCCDPAVGACYRADRSFGHPLAQPRLARRGPATNVLSFPTPRSSGKPPLIGDIVLAYQTIAGEARAEHRPFAHHVAHLAGAQTLHLIE